MNHNYSTYSNHKCRCDTCQAAWAAYNAKRRAERRLGISGVVSKGGRSGPQSHNASTYTNWGCRCDLCRADWNTYYRAYHRERRRLARTEASQ